MTRYLPDEGLLVAEVLNDVDSSSRVPVDLATKLPRRVIFKLSGTAVHPKFLDRPLVQISSYATSYAAAKALAEDARVALYDAWRSQTRYAHGVVHRVTEVASPFEVRTGTEPDGVFRFDQTHQIWTRP